MIRSAIFLLLISCVCSSVIAADSPYYLGTRTGWRLTDQVFMEGRYKQTDMFIVIGVKPTNEAIHTILGWKSKTTYGKDLSDGYDSLTKQLEKSADSIPDNFKSLGDSFHDLVMDPVKEIGDLNIFSPAVILYKTTVNILRIGFHTVMIPAEPVARTGYGTVRLVTAPIIKPVMITTAGMCLLGTAVYGYSSSAVAGTIMAGATGTVLVLDTVTLPVAALIDSHTDQTVKTSDITSGDSAIQIKYVSSDDDASSDMDDSDETE